MSMKQIKNCRFITLSLTPWTGKLEDQLDYLRDSFRRLRQQNIWKSKVTFGYGIIEVTYNREDGWWYPHLHCLVHGDYIPKQLLSRCWMRATKGTYIVKINLVKDRKHVINYISKYLSKSIDFNDIKHDHRLGTEYIDATKDRKMLIRFGKHPKLIVKPKPDDEQVNQMLSDWRVVCSFSEVVRGILKNDAWAIKVLCDIHRKGQTKSRGRPPNEVSRV